MGNLVIFSDGGARGNPGPAAAAFVVEEDGKIIEKEAVYLGKATNNIAEYQAVILALKWLTSKASMKDKVFPSIGRASNIKFILDSELVVNQLNGLYKVKNENLRNLFYTIKTLEKKLNTKINYLAVGREKNKLADFLVNEKLDQTP
jgi:ribonuclease HI